MTGGYGKIDVLHVFRKVFGKLHKAYVAEIARLQIFAFEVITYSQNDVFQKERHDLQKHVLFHADVKMIDAVEHFFVAAAPHLFHRGGYALFERNALCVFPLHADEPG